MYLNTNFQSKNQRALICFVCALPILNLLAWEEWDLFSTPLTHRIWVVWTEIIFVLWCLLTKARQLAVYYQNQNHLAFLYIFLVFGFMSANNAENPYASIVRQAELIFHLTFFSCLRVIINDENRRYILWGIVLAGLYSCYHFALLNLAVANRPYEWTQDIPFFSNIRHWGYLLVLMPGICLWIFNNGNQRQKYIALSLYFIFFTAICWSGARGAFWATIISVFIIYPVLFRPNRKFMLLLLTISLFGIAMAKLLEANHPSLSVNRLLFILDDRFFEQTQDLFNKLSSGRLDIWRHAIHDLMSKSPLIGFGGDNFRYAIPQPHTVATHPHNIIIQFIYSYGILGFILFCYPCYHFIKNSPTKKLKLFLLLLAPTLLASLLDGNLYHTSSIFCIVLILAVIFYSPQQEESSAFKKPYLICLLIFTVLIPVIIWVKHSQTFLILNQPLIRSEQIEKIEQFPSIIVLNGWLQAEDKNLVKQALYLGGTWSDNQCASYLMLMLRFHEPVQDHLVKSCHSNFVVPGHNNQ